jgi:chromosome partitioning protein
LTDIALPRKHYETLEEIEDVIGLYKLLYEKYPINEVIQHTEIPTLDIIPETHDLNLLEKALRLANRREYYFKDKLLPLLSGYDVIIFDNGPSWNQLIENALTVSDTVISPIGCDLLSYKAMETNLNTIFEFGKGMKILWDNILLVPTLLEKNKLSQQIYGAYLTKYADIIISNPIRRAIKGQESLIFGQTSIEHDPTSPLAQDYFELIQEMWKKIGA